MLSSAVSRGVGLAAVRRGLRTSSAALATDPVQQLFLDKVSEYAKKQGGKPGALVDETAEDRKALQDEMDRVAKTFRIASQKDAETFPTFAFKDPVFDSIHLADAQK